MKKSDLEIVLKLHKKWLNDEDGGVCANLIGVDLRRADLKCADLRGADLRGADLRRANLGGADLRRADLRRANLRRTNLIGANLSNADLRCANLIGADLDFSVFPLWCGSFDIKVNRRLVVQLLYHICRLECEDEEIINLQKSLLPLANEFHRVGECGKLK